MLRVAAIFVALAIAACGGSRDTHPLCTPSGLWRVTDERSGIVPDYVNANQGDCGRPEMSVVTTDVRVSILEYGKSQPGLNWLSVHSGYGPFDWDSCSATVVSGLLLIGPDGVAKQETLIARSITFTAKTGAGGMSYGVLPTGPESGSIACFASFRTTAVRIGD